MPKKRMSDAERVEHFWSQVRKTDGDGCWEWQGWRHKFGYGSVQLTFRGPSIAAHRAAWMLTNGPIPTGMQACHKCDNPPCVRPDHIFLGTCFDNMRDKVAKGRQHRGTGTFGSVLDDEKAAVILRTFAEGKVHATALCEQHGITMATMNALLYGRTWLHVDAPRLPHDKVREIVERHRVDGIRAAVARGAGPGVNVGLTNERVSEILHTFASGDMGMGALAERYGVSATTIHRIVHGQRWTHVAGPRLDQEEMRALYARQRADRDRLVARKAA
jgi:DNA-binding Xre family transcriptional regulator